MGAASPGHSSIFLLPSCFWRADFCSNRWFLQGFLAVRRWPLADTDTRFFTAPFTRFLPVFPGVVDIENEKKIQEEVAEGGGDGVAAGAVEGALEAACC